MSDLISRQAAIDELERGAWGKKWDKTLAKAMIESVPSAEPEADEWCADCKEYDHDKHCCPRWNRVIRTALEEAQPERKRGRWIDGQCSICGCDIPAYIIDWKWQKDMDANFCPNCGARMEAKDE